MHGRLPGVSDATTMPAMSRTPVAQSPPGSSRARPIASNILELSTLERIMKPFCVGVRQDGGMKVLCPLTWWNSIQIPFPTLHSSSYTSLTMSFVLRDIHSCWRFAEPEEHVETVWRCAAFHRQSGILFDILATEAQWRNKTETAYTHGRGCTYRR